jgi:hypothetical protein
MHPRPRRVFRPSLAFPRLLGCEPVRGTSSLGMRVVDPNGLLPGRSSLLRSGRMRWFRRVGALSRKRDRVLSPRVGTRDKLGSRTDTDVFQQVQSSSTPMHAPHAGQLLPGGARAGRAPQGCPPRTCPVLAVRARETPARRTARWCGAPSEDLPVDAGLPPSFGRPAFALASQRSCGSPWTFPLGGWASDVHREDARLCRPFPRAEAGVASCSGPCSLVSAIGVMLEPSGARAQRARRRASSPSRRKQREVEVIAFGPKVGVSPSSASITDCPVRRHRFPEAVAWGLAARGRATPSAVVWTALVSRRASSCLPGSLRVPRDASARSGSGSASGLCSADESVAPISVAGDGRPILPWALFPLQGTPSTPLRAVFVRAASLHPFAIRSSMSLPRECHRGSYRASSEDEAWRRWFEVCPVRRASVPVASPRRGPWPSWGS